MNSETHPNTIVVQKIWALAQKRLEIMTLTPERMLDTILADPQPAALVHSFPEQDFYFLIHEIGVEDSMELLALASDRQWEFIIDSEAWRRDRIDLNAMTRWLSTLMDADPIRMVRWISREQLEWLEVYLFWNVDVAIRTHDQDPSELGEGFDTDDDVFYVRLVDHNSPAEGEARVKSGRSGRERNGGEGETDRDQFLWSFLQRLSAYDHLRYQQILLESMAVVPAEAEEEAFRMRNVRLAEKGFLPYHEAVGVYQPLDVRAFRRYRREKLLSGPASGQVSAMPPPVPISHLRMAEPDNDFVRALQAIDAPDLFAYLQTEFAGLCNQVIAADNGTVREKSALREAVRKVCGYVSLGLAALRPSGVETNPARDAALIRHYPISEIFRVGFGKAMNLKWKAEKWRKTSWFEANGLPLTFWDEEWLGVLGGLLLKRPMFFDNYETGTLYRDFARDEDIQTTRRVLNRIITADRLLAALDISPVLSGDMLLTWKSWLLTLWARGRLGMESVGEPVPVVEFRGFYETLWEENGDGRRISDASKQDFAAWLTAKTGIDRREIGETYAPLLEGLFLEIDAEYRSVTAADIDPRYVRMFLIA